MAPNLSFATINKSTLSYGVYEVHEGRKNTIILVLQKQHSCILLSTGGHPFTLYPMSGPEGTGPIGKLIELAMAP